jgi:hypothetical protein
MKKLVTLVVLAAGIGGFFLWSGRWHWLTSEEGHFRVEVRGRLKLKASDEKTAGKATIAMREWRARPLLGKAEFAVLYLEMNAPSLSSAEVAGALENARSAMVRERGGPQRERGQAMLAGQLATEYEVEAAEPKTHIRYRTLVAAPRVYVVAFSFRGDEEPPGQADRFFGSFELQ